MTKNAADRFLEAARKHGAATLEGDSRLANSAYHDLVSALQDLRRTPDSGVTFLRSELYNKDATVVTWAAFYLLPFEESAALEALHRVIAKDIPRVSLGAEMTLREWQAGRLKFD